MSARKSMYCVGFDYGSTIICLEGETANIDDFYPLIVLGAQKVIEWLEKGKVIVIGNSEEYQSIDYAGNRYVDAK